MNDSYQPIYDATRSRISNSDSGDAIYRAARECFDVSHLTAILYQEFSSVAYEQARPCVLFRPKISTDGDQWCALYGDNLQDGVAGFGKSPREAMEAFDKAWADRLPGSTP